MKSTTDKLADYRKRLAVWKRAHGAAMATWDAPRVKVGPAPTVESCQPEKCEPKDFGLDDSTVKYTDQIRKEVLGI